MCYSAGPCMGDAMTPEPTPSLVDRVAPILVGSRTELLALAVLLLKIASDLGWISPETFTLLSGILWPAGAATLAAKIGRLQTTEAQVARRIEPPIAVTPVPAPPPPGPAPGGSTPAPAPGTLP